MVVEMRNREGKDVWLRLAVHDVLAYRVGSIEIPLKIVTSKAEEHLPRHPFRYRAGFAVCEFELQLPAPHTALFARSKLPSPRCLQSELRKILIPRFFQSEILEVLAGSGQFQLGIGNIAG